MFQKTENVYRLHGIASEKCDWIDNITKLGLRKNAHDEDGRYRRSTNSNVIDHLCFDAVYATGSTYDMIMADLKYVFEIYWQGVLSGKSQKIDIGSKVPLLPKKSANWALPAWALPECYRWFFLNFLR
jgi:hypothetical protein